MFDLKPVLDFLSGLDPLTFIALAALSVAAFALYVALRAIEGKK